MALVPETGQGVSGADTYAARTTILEYWASRPHDPLAATVAEADVEKLDGAAREATAYIDATFGPYYRGQRMGFVQGLLWPRSNALDEAGFPLPDLPQELVTAVCELSARALSDRLAADIDLTARVESEKVGPIATKYFDTNLMAPTVSYGFVGNLLAPILTGAQPMAPNAAWSWA